MAKALPKKSTDEQLKDVLKSHKDRLDVLLKVGEKALTDSKKMELAYLRQEIKQIENFLARRDSKTA